MPKVNVYTSIGNGSWIGSPLPVPPPPPPPTLIRPTAANTGTTGPLTVRNGNIYLTTPGTVLDSLDIHGFVIIYAANCIVRNCRVRGNGPQNTTAAGAIIKDSALIDCNPAGCKNAQIIHCELAHDFPSVWVDGVIGHDYTARYNHIHNVVDAFGVYNSGAPAANANVIIEYNYGHDMNYMSPDPEISDNHTHNDGVQIQGNGNIRIYGNDFQDIAGPSSNTRSPYFPACTGQAIGFTPNVSTIHDVLVDSNWLDGGAQAITGKPISGRTVDNATVLLRNNRFGRRMPPLTKQGVSARRAILMDPGITLVGMPTSLDPNGALDLTNGNVWDDNGQPILYYRLPA